MSRKVLFVVAILAVVAACALAIIATIWHWPGMGRMLYGLFG